MCEIEPDLWAAWLTAGACRRAAKKDRARHRYWEGQARAYSRRAAVLMAWDAVTWRCPQETAPR
jgi:hypothetical protein